MKMNAASILAFVSALMLAPAHGWMHSLSDKKALPKQQSTMSTTRTEWHKAVAVAAVSAAVLVATSPVAANAASPADFTGSYSDPFHPNCQRVISSSKSSTTLTIRGTDGNPGCPADGTGNPWTLTGTLGDNGQSVLVDFTPKGGPPNLKGVWDLDSTTPGIKWPDGNKWTKIG